jgi:hypothetical protein
MTEENHIPESDQPPAGSEQDDVTQADLPASASQPNEVSEQDRTPSAPEPAVRPPAPAPDHPRPGTTSYPPRPQKDKGVALILEILPGLFGILGLGWIYSGNTVVGVAWLVGMLVWDFIAVLVLIFSGGLGCLCTIPINLVAVAVSAFFLNNYISQHDELFTVQ